MSNTNTVIRTKLLKQVREVTVAMNLVARDWSSINTVELGVFSGEAYLGSVTVDGGLLRVNTAAFAYAGARGILTKLCSTVNCLR